MTRQRGWTFAAATIGCVAIAAMVVTDNAQAAGGAYAVDTAEVSSPGSCKVESWVSSADNGDLLAAVSPGCVVNLTRPVELSSQFSRSGSSGEWATAATPKLKTNLLPSGIGIWGLAISATASYDLSTGENTAVSVVLPATLRLSEAMRINLNVGWQQDRTLNRPYFLYGAAFDIRTLDNVWIVTGEMFGQAGATEDANLVRPRFQLGLRFRPIDRFNVDLIYGRNITGENANWLTVATIVRFPAK